jgi:hypothetical protein
MKGERYGETVNVRMRKAGSVDEGRKLRDESRGHG